MKLSVVAIKLDLDLKYSDSLARRTFDVSELCDNLLTIMFAPTKEGAPWKSIREPHRHWRNAVWTCVWAMCIRVRLYVHVCLCWILIRHTHTHTPYPQGYKRSHLCTYLDYACLRMHSMQEDETLASHNRLVSYTMSRKLIWPHSCCGCFSQTGSQRQHKGAGMRDSTRSSLPALTSNNPFHLSPSFALAWIDGDVRSLRQDDAVGSHFSPLLKPEHQALKWVLIHVQHADLLEKSHFISFSIAPLRCWTWHAANRQRMGLGGPTQTGGQREGGEGRGGRYELNGGREIQERERERDDRTMWRPHRIENSRVKSSVRGVRLQPNKRREWRQHHIFTLFGGFDTVLRGPSVAVKQSGLC